MSLLSSRDDKAADILGNKQRALNKNRTELAFTTKNIREKLTGGLKAQNETSPRMFEELRCEVYTALKIICLKLT